MDIQEILKIMDRMEDSKITHFSLEEKGVKLELKKETTKVAYEAPVKSEAIATQPVKEVAAHREIMPSFVEEETGCAFVTSPIVGTFYTAASPATPAFVKVGDTVKKGQTLCIVEAMKLMNEIEAEQAGEILEVLVKNEEMVEFGQKLFKVRLS